MLFRSHIKAAQWRDKHFQEQHVTMRSNSLLNVARLANAGAGYAVLPMFLAGAFSNISILGDAIDGLDRIIMAQPRPLAPSENVALDNWVRGGGRLLIFADPLLTRHSDFALGDRRRPQDVVLLSPILTRWGLELRFDDAQPSEERLISASGNQYPVNLAGQFVATGDGKCTISEAGLFARCSVGNGRVTLMADAAILDSEETAATSAPRQVLLATLIGDALD